MGRKSRAEVRREEILAAFERCVGRYGIDVPLERVAEEAGVQRSLIRHYLGNRDEVVGQLIERITEAYPQHIVDRLAPAVEHGTERVLDVFFGADMIAPEWDTLIHAVVSSTQGRYPQAKQQVARMLVAIIGHIAAALEQLFPHATAEACYETAYAVLCLIYAHEDLRWLGLDARHSAMTRSRAAYLLGALAVRPEGDGKHTKAL